jgi:transposase
MEVVMRPPEVFVRPLAHGEAVALKRRSKRAKHFSTRQRASILLASNTGMSAPEIARMWQTDESHVRRVIHEFNERGLDSLDPDYRGGRPRRITDEQRRRIVAVAGARPDTQGVPLTRWSLPRLAAHLRSEGIEISPAHLGRVLKDAGLSFQRTRSWKASPDPDYERKAARVLALYERAPADGVVVCFDQMGPISLRPTHGSGGRRSVDPKGTGRRSTAATASATASAPTTSTKTGSGSGCGVGAPAPTRSPSCARSAAAIRAGSGSTGSRTASRPTGPPTSAHSPPTTTSSSSRCPPTPAT